ncbi:MAG: phosphoribosylglycinamide formyltransferase [Pseudomonadales bacterium]|nr:phosphoribosylglycinamide formyltransferase [Pseudomonadales bacterium]
MQRLVVLISGSGSNLQSIIDACKNSNRLHAKAEIVAVIANKPDAFGLQRAADQGIPALCINHTEFASRELFDQHLAQVIQDYQADLVILAGFMRILTPAFTQQFAGKLLNIHPSLLPKYPGLNTHQRAIDANDAFAGATVHFVTAELDGGPCILQAAVAIDGDDAKSLAAKVLQQEHKIYPEVICWFVEKRLRLDGNTAWLDGKAIPKHGVQFETA